MATAFVLVLFFALTLKLLAALTALPCPTHHAGHAILKISLFLKTYY